MRANFLIALGLLLVGVQGARANTYTFDTQAVGGQNFSGVAVFTLTSGSLDVVLSNTTSVTQNAGDLLRSLQFQISNPTLTSGTLSSISGSMITVDGAGNYAPDASEPNVTLSDWGLSSGLQLSAAMPDNTIIGPPTGSPTPNYAAANNSITGNGPHNPFAFESIEFKINVTGLLPTSNISNVIFGYGTQSSTTPSTLVPNIVTVPVPAPVYAGLALLGTMGIMLKLGRRNAAC